MQSYKRRWRTSDLNRSLYIHTNSLPERFEFETQQKRYAIIYYYIFSLQNQVIFDSQLYDFIRNSISS